MTAQRGALAVRRMTVPDIDVAVGLLREHEPFHDVEQWQARFLRDIGAADRHPVVALLDREVIGYARTLRFQPDGDAPANTAPSGHYLLGLVVGQAHRRHGAGRRLTEERLRWIAQQDSGATYYFTGRDNTASQQLHRQLGFRRLTADFSFPSLAPDHTCVLFVRSHSPSFPD